QLGHIVSGRWVKAPMSAVLVTATLPVNVYDDEGETHPREVHLARAVGGPIASAVAFIFFFFLAVSLGWSLLWIASLSNLLLCLGSLAPVESLDGSVIWQAQIQRRSV